LLYVHGINDYGGKFGEHAKPFLDQGYRMIIPDMPSHGRSTGLHAYITTMDALADAVHSVLCDVAFDDQKEGRDAAQKKRKIFVAGQVRTHF